MGEPREPHAGFTQLARQMLPELLGRHRVEAALGSDGAVALPGIGRVECNTFEEKAPGGTLHAVVDARLWLDRYPELPIATPLSGYGADPVHAVGDALVDFVHRILAPVRAMLGEDDTPPGTVTTRTTGGDGATTDRQWAVYEGEPSLVHAGPPDQPTLQDVLRGKTLLALLVDPVADAVNAWPERRLHWIKLFLALQRPNGQRITECLVDNVPYRRTERLESFEWPEYAGLLGLRHFAVVVERPSAATP